MNRTQRNKLAALEMGLDKMIREYEEAIPGQKGLMDEGNSYAAGRWTEMVDIVRYAKWIKRMAD